MSAYIEFVVTSDVRPQLLIHIMRRVVLPEVVVLRLVVGGRECFDYNRTSLEPQQQTRDDFPLLLGDHDAPPSRPGVHLIKPYKLNS